MTGLALPTQGTIYGVLLNTGAERQAWGNALGQAPYGRPPEAPVLYIKPYHTRNQDRAPIVVPDGVATLNMGATLGIVIGRTATRLDAAHALDHVLGYVVANDVAEAHASIHRPAMRQRCRDGFCVLSGRVAPVSVLAEPGRATVDCYVNGTLRQRRDTADAVRPLPALLAALTSYMTLHPGDIVLATQPATPIEASAGDEVRVEIAGVGTLTNPLVAASAYRAGAAA